MKLKLLFFILSIFIGSEISAQQDQFYATTDAENAKALKNIFPDEVQIIAVENQHAAVYLTKEAAHHLHKNVITHGPGYVYKPSKEDALKSIQKNNRSNKILNFTINQDAVVNDAINQVNAENIKNHIQILENYGTRRHNTASATQSVNDLKTKWENLILATGRTDISVRLVSHVGTPMKSVVLTINGTNSNDYIIVGAHMDSISSNSQAPGADDDASGIATITEIIRVLLNKNFKPQNTVEFMAFAAEEIGLVGSSEIASNYASTGKNVLSYVQFDMTNFKGSVKDIYFTTDSYNSNNLNLFLMELIAHYNTTGSHIFNYGTTICNYGCSDHFSWAENGFDAAFPFEASFSNSNPYIHGPNDKLVNMGNNADHAAKFAKLGLEFIIETAKSTTLFASEINKSEVEIYIDQKILKFRSGKNGFKSIMIVDASGRKLVDKHNLLSVGQLDLSGLSKGFYLAVFQNNEGKVFTKKFILE